MNFFLTLLGVVLALNVFYHFASHFFTWLRTGFPAFCRCVFTRARILIRLLVEIASLCTPTKELNRTNAIRRRLSTYIEVLEKGQGHANIQQWWRFYVANVPEQYRHIDRENGRLYALPWWLEQLCLPLNNTTLVMILKFLVFYLVMLFTMHLWLPYIVSVPLHPLEAIQLTLHEHLNLHLEPCIWIAESDEPHCFLQQRHLLNHTTLQLLTEARLLSTQAAPGNMSFLVGPDDKVYYAVDVLGDGVTRYINTEETLVPLLSEETCVCALFLNILSDLSFLYEQSEQRWIVMRDATLYRNNSFAELVASKIAYNRKSRLFNKHREWQSLVEEELIHYDSFVVEYTESTSSVAEADASLAIMHDKLREAEYREAGVFRRLRNDDTLERKQLHVSGSDAICFVYCDRVARAYKTRNTSKIN